MVRRINLIWDFRGIDSLQTAKHHCIHLKEYVNIHNLNWIAIDIVQKSEFYNYVFITINENDIKIFRDALKPHRGELVSQ